MNESNRKFQEAVEQITEGFKELRLSSESKQGSEEEDLERKELDVLEGATTPENIESFPNSEKTDKPMENPISDSDHSESSLEKVDLERRESLDHPATEVITLDSESAETEIIVCQDSLKKESVRQISSTFNIGSVLDSLKKPDSEESYEFFTDEAILDNYKNDIQEPVPDVSLPFLAKTG